MREVTEIRTLGWASKTGFHRKILKIADSITASLATEILAVSHSEKLFLEKEKIAPLGKIQVLGNGSICGVDLDRYHPSPAKGRVLREQLDISPEAFVILFIGRMVRDKGLLELARAFKTIAESRSDCYLIFVGPNEDPAALEVLKILDGIKKQYRMIGYSHEAEKYLSAADILCLPSYREGFPIVILEAAAMKVPAIGSRIYGVSDAIIDRVTGMLCEVGDSSSLTSVLYDVMNNEALRIGLGEAAYTRVRSQFDSRLVVERYLNFFLSLFNKSEMID